MFLLLGGTFLFPYISNAQSVFTVKDKTSRQPIEYAQVALLRINQGATTNAEGKFTLDNYLLKDSVIISSLGYTSEKLTIKDLAANPVIHLTKAPIALNEVAVSARKNSIKFHRRQIGWIDKRVNAIFPNLGRICSQKGARIVVWVNNEENQAGAIEGLIVKLLPRPESNDNQPALIRVWALSGNQTTGPDNEAGIASTVFVVKPGTQTLHIDLQKSQLYLPASGGFVGIEWLVSEQKMLPVCVGTTNSDLTLNEVSATWQSYRGKKWGQFGVRRGVDGKVQRLSNSNARIDAVVAFPNK